MHCCRMPSKVSARSLKLTAPVPAVPPMPVITRAHPDRAGIWPRSPITGVPHVSPSVGIPVTTHPCVVRPRRRCYVSRGRNISRRRRCIVTVSRVSRCHSDPHSHHHARECRASSQKQKSKQFRFHHSPPHMCPECICFAKLEVIIAVRFVRAIPHPGAGRFAPPGSISANARKSHP